MRAVEPVTCETSRNDDEARGYADRRASASASRSLFGSRRSPTDTARVDAHELESLDLLRLAVFEDLEVRRCQAFDDAIVAHRVGVNEHEVRAAAEHGTLRGLLRREHHRRGQDEPARLARSRASRP